MRVSIFETLTKPGRNHENASMNKFQILESKQMKNILWILKSELNQSKRRRKIQFKTQYLIKCVITSCVVEGNYWNASFDGKCHNVVGFRVMGFWEFFRVKIENGEVRGSKGFQAVYGKWIFHKSKVLDFRTQTEIILKRKGVWEARVTFILTYQLFLLEVARILSLGLQVYS